MQADLRERVATKVDEWIGDASTSQEIADAAIAAVLDAMREPCERMVKKGAYQVSGLRHEGARCVWAAMLTAFREEQLGEK